MRRRVVFNLVVIDDTVYTMLKGHAGTPLAPYQSFRPAITGPAVSMRDKITRMFLLRLVSGSDVLT